MRAVAALLALVALECAAAPFAVRIGKEQVVLDAPPGFSDTLNMGSPRLQDLAASLTSASNRVVLFGLSDPDYRRFTLGDPADFKRYLVAATARDAEEASLGIEQFARLSTDWRGSFGEIVKPPELLKFLDGQPIGRVHLLHELRKEPTATSVILAMRLPPLPGKRFFDPATPQYQIFTETLLLVRGKVLRLTIFALYENSGDGEWLRTTTERWIDDLRRLNR
jgi:hypothetical protein